MARWMQIRPSGVDSASAQRPRSEIPSGPRPQGPPPMGARTSALRVILSVLHINVCIFFFETSPKLVYLSK